MKNAFLIAIVALLLPASLARADSRNCVLERKDESENTVKKALFSLVVQELRSKRIELDPDNSHLNVQMDLKEIAYDQYAEISVFALLTSRSGTEFSVDVDAQGLDYLSYGVLSAQKGFDREGNTIGGHCTLDSFEDGGGIVRTVTYLNIVNTKTQQVVARVHQPRTLKLF